MKRKILLLIFILKRHPKPDLHPYSKVEWALLMIPPQGASNSINLICSNGSHRWCIHYTMFRNLKQVIFPVLLSSLRSIFTIKHNTASEKARNAGFSWTVVSQVFITGRKEHLLLSKKVNPHHFTFCRVF